MAVLTDALATKLLGDTDSEFRLDWTEEQRLDSTFLLVSALHLEALRRSGMFEVRSIPPDPWALGAAFECRLTDKPLSRFRRLAGRELIATFFPDAWRAPPDFVESEGRARRFDRLMSQRRRTTWVGGSLFPSGTATRHAC